MTGIGIYMGDGGVKRSFTIFIHTCMHLEAGYKLAFLLIAKWQSSARKALAPNVRLKSDPSKEKSVQKQISLYFVQHKNLFLSHQRCYRHAFAHKGREMNKKFKRLHSRSPHNANITPSALRMNTQ